MNKSLGIYIHIPFCARKCNYCDFLSAPAKREQIRRYTEMLCEEIRLNQELLTKYRVDTVFIGGGTPSYLTLEDMDRILQALYKNVHFAESIEFTVECNPRTVDKKKLEFYYESGINRISFGLQSAIADELRNLGRIHSWADFLECYHQAKEAGFVNINVDLMSGIPGQTVKSYEETCRKVLALQPQHLSAYSLIIEEGTPFFEKYSETPPVTEELDRSLYALTKQIFAEQGYHRYEISNYSQPGMECRHNLKYWLMEEYLGFGLGAASLLDQCRFKNEVDMQNYVSKLHRKEKPWSVEEKLTEKDAMEEFMFLGLRKCEGISEQEFREKFHRRIEEVYHQTIVSMEEKELLKREKGRIALTDKGLDVSNYVMAEFIL